MKEIELHVNIVSDKKLIPIFIYVSALLCTVVSLFTTSPWLLNNVGMFVFAVSIVGHIVAGIWIVSRLNESLSEKEQSE